MASDAVFLSGWEYNRVLQDDPLSPRQSALPAESLWNGGGQFWLFKHVYCAKESLEGEREGADMLDEDGLLTIVVKNVKRKHVMYTLAWDLAFRLCGPTGDYERVGTALWCQDDVGIKPFAVGTHWVSNTLHHYCLHLARRG